MRVALISDSHGNYVALAAILRDMTRQEIDRVVCLGDMIQGGAQPKETLDAVRELDCPVIMGNSDDFLLGSTAEPIDKLPSSAIEIREWTLSRLSDDDTAFIRNFEPTVIERLVGNHHLLCFHGSPTSYLDIILPHTEDARVDGWLTEPRAQYFAGGHTHLQQIRKVANGLFVNPGSVGAVFDIRLPQDQIRLSPWGEYAVLSIDATGVSIDFRRVNFDLNEMEAQVRRSGRPYGDELLAQYGLETV